MHKCLPTGVDLKLQCVLLLLSLVLLLQIFLPLLTPHMDSSAAGEQQGAAPSPFTVLRDVVLRQGSNLTAEDIERGKGQPMEQLGVALTFGKPCLRALWCGSALIDSPAAVGALCKQQTCRCQGKAVVAALFWHLP
jgi:hypothetical protein